MEHGEMKVTQMFKLSEVQRLADVLQAYFADPTTGEDDVIDASAAHMSTDKLRRFLMEVQEEHDESRAQSESERIVHLICQRNETHDVVTNHLGLTVDGFFQYLFDNDLNGPIHTEVHHEMNAPLQHYFIFTGHNSYLTGNQLLSNCSDEPIIKALQRGVRVIELDLWPNPSKDNIIVVHGRTLTTPVSFATCLTSIKDHAFERSSYPVIINLEDHLTLSLQAKVVQMVMEIFGDILYYTDLNNLEELPSPEELKHRILIFANPPKEHQDDSQELEEDEKKEQLLEDDDLVSGSEEVEIEDYGQNEPEYKQLIVIQSWKPTKGLKQALNTTTGLGKFRCLNLSEGVLEKAVSDYATDLLRFAMKNFVRMYPKGTRIRSSNYQPLVAWTHGAQMVAFNMQGYGKALWLMHGMFRANGGCGYIKKPNFLLNHELHLENEAHRRVMKTLKVRVYMGYGWCNKYSQTHDDFDAYCPPDFYTKVRLMGVPGDCDKKKTKVIYDNWVPIWDEEFSFKLTVPELALLRFEVREDDMLNKDDFGGQTCLPVSEIKPGIRVVQLFDKKGEKLANVKLLVRFQFVPNCSS